MNDIQAKLGEIFRDKERLERMLLLEKKRRGVSHDVLVFLGMADVAQHWWCTQQGVFKSRVEEVTYFSRYLIDRIQYAHSLRLVTEVPTSDEALLDVGKEITFADIQKLLRRKAGAQKRSEQADRKSSITATWVSHDRRDRSGNYVQLINPDLPPEKREFEKWKSAQDGVQLIDLEQEPKRRGEVYQQLRAEKLSTIGWHFPWGRYTIVGKPDGIGDDFVYEYKTTGSQFLLRFMKPVAFAQADLYGYFFRQPKKRVQIHIVEENVTKTWEESIDSANAERTLSEFARVDAGGSARSPVAWKCRKCDYQATCPISQAK